jgi:hypothetical protein
MQTVLAIVLFACFAAMVTAMHLRLTSRPLTPMPLGSIDDIDAEFYRIIEREGLRDLIR